MHCTLRIRIVYNKITIYYTTIYYFKIDSYKNRFPPFQSIVYSANFHLSKQIIFRQNIIIYHLSTILKLNINPEGAQGALFYF